MKNSQLFSENCLVSANTGLTKAGAAVKTKPLTAKQITAEVLIGIPKRFPFIRAWRNNRIDAMAPGRNGTMRRISAGIDGQGDICGIIGQSIAGATDRRRIQSLRALAERPGTEAEGDLAEEMLEKFASRVYKTIGGRMLQIEVKATYVRGHDRMSPSQLAFRHMILSHGGVYIVATSAEQCFADLADAVGV